MTPRILVVEDEPHLAQGIADNLALEGYSVEVAGDGEAALRAFERARCDLIILDVMLPKVDGYAVCQTIRAQGGTLPILFLTAKNSSAERLYGLEAGGDDYLGKPFDLQELLMRVRAMLRRQRWHAAAPTPAAAVTLCSLKVDFAALVVIGPDGRREALPAREAQLLRYFIDHPHEMLERDTLVQQVWGLDAYPSSRELEQQVQALRQRFEPEPHRPQIFHTLPGVGYRFTPI